MKHKPFRIIFSSLNILVVFALFGSVSTGISPTITPDSTRLQSASTAGIPNDLPRRLIAMDQSGGVAQGLDIQAGLAYVGFGPRLEVFDVSHPDLPILLGQSNPLTGIIREVEVNGGFAYITTCGQEGLANRLNILNVQGPHQITVLGFIPFTGCNQINFVVQGDYVYLPYNNELRVIDVKDPRHPELVNRVVATTGTLVDIDIVGNYLYLPSTDYELLVFDITDPAVPAILTTVSAPWARSLVKISVHPPYLYVIDLTNLYIYDIHELNQPNLVSTSSLFSHAQDIAALNDYVAVSEAMGTEGLSVVDVRNPSKPVTVSYLDMKFGGYEIEASGTLVYIAADVAGFRIVDVRDPQNPNEIGNYATVPKLWSLALKDGFAYGGDQFGALSVLDLQGKTARQAGLYQPSPETDQGNYTCPNGYWLFGDITLYDVSVSGDYVYAAAGVNGLQVFSVVNPSKPTPVGNLDTAGSAFGVAVSGDKAYIADYCYGLRVIDVQDPVHPVEVGSYVGIERAMGVAMFGHYAYVADQYAGLFVLDVQDPAAPVKVLELPGADAWDVQVLGQYLYLPGAQNFQIYDLSNPAVPALLGELDEFGYYVTVDGDVAYLSAQSRIKAIDIHDPAHPALIDWKPTPGLARGVATYNGNIYIAYDDGGLYVMKLTDKVYFLPVTFR